MTYNEFTTFGEICSLSAKVLEENDVFILGKRKLAHIFLCELLELNRNSTYTELEEAYKACSPGDKAPENSEEFWTFVEKQYLRLKEEPKEKFFEICVRVNKDLVALAENLSYINKEIVILEEKKRTNGRLTADERYYRNQLEYFRNKNCVAKDEIIDFMTHKIKKYAISTAHVQNSFIALASSLFENNPYPFGRRSIFAHSDPYDVRSLDTYSNKFLDLPISDYYEIVIECRSSPENFKQYAIDYINGVHGQLPTVKEKLLKLIKKSHILFNRKNVIETMLRHFETKDYISFVSMAPLQIEGIFADICREIGVSESQLDISSLNDKLQHIDGKMQSFLFFEYYSFKFPVLRNLVAHGGLVDGELEDTAIHLMLDLLPVCELAISEDLPIANALNVLEEASNGTPEQLVKWLDLRKSIAIPDFYGVQDSITKAEAHYSSQSFWDFLEAKLRMVQSVDAIRSSDPLKVAGKIKAAGLAHDKAEKFLRSAVSVAKTAIKQRDEQYDSLINR